MSSGSLRDSPVLLAAVATLLSACSSDSNDHADSADASGGAGTGGTSVEAGSTGGTGPGSGGVSTGGSGTGGLVSSGGVSTGGSGGGGLVGSGGVSTGGSGVGGLVGSGGASAGGSGVGGLVGGGGTSAGGDGGATTGGQAATGGDSGAGSDSGGTAGTAGASTGTPSAGCGKAPTLTSGEHTIQSGGQSRSFMMRIPDTYDNNHPHRLIFAFHWNGGTMQDVDGGGTSGYTWSYYGLRERAENSTIFVAPQGNGNGWANPGGQDLTFVDDMINLIKDDSCVDEDRLFAMGFSYGGGMSYAIACDRADVFRAVAVYAGARLSGCNDGTRPIAYMGIHSVNDPTCSYTGGEGLRDTFVGNNHCTPQDPPEPPAGSMTHIITEYEGCDPGYPVVWAAFEGAGHTPAPVDGSTADSGGGDVTWTKEEVWNFFTQF